MLLLPPPKVFIIKSKIKKVWGEASRASHTLPLKYKKKSIKNTFPIPSHGLPDLYYI